VVRSHPSAINITVITPLIQIPYIKFVAGDFDVV